MYICYLDESGYSPKWKNDLREQPFYVQAAVLLPISPLEDIYSGIRNELSKAELPRPVGDLGRGFEIKAKDVARGRKWWGDKERDRNHVREVMLAAPSNHGGTAIVVVIDKACLLEKYGNDARDPHQVAFRYTLERVQWFLNREQKSAICVYDQNKQIDDDVHRDSGSLASTGSPIFYFSEALGQYISYAHKVDRVVEMTLGYSENSLGLNVADFFATMTYHYFKDGQPDECGWWDTLAKSLDRRNGKQEGRLDGYGLKVFP